MLTGDHLAATPTKQDVPPLPAAPDLCTAYVEWLDYLRSEKRVSAHTFDAYAREGRTFILFLARHLGEPPDLAALNDLRPADIRAFLAAHHQGRVNRSMARLLSSVRAFYRFLHKTRRIDLSAVTAIRAAKLPHSVPRPVSPDAAREMIDHSAERSEPGWVRARDVAVVTLLYGGGLRISEALGLDRAALPQGTQATDPARWATFETLRLIGKGKKERIVPVLPQVRLALSDYLAAAPFAPPGDAPLFRGVQGGRLSPRIVQRLVATVRTNLGLPDRVTPHALRHAFASHLLAAGADLRAIQELLGHASLSSTQIYTEVDTTTLLKAYKAHPQHKDDMPEES
ncbi:MAG: tyrosine recombinase XerC [Alphaproteobacteria bacterium]